MNRLEILIIHDIPEKWTSVLAGDILNAHLDTLLPAPNYLPHPSHPLVFTYFFQKAVIHFMAPLC